MIMIRYPPIKIGLQTRSKTFATYGNGYGITTDPHKQTCHSQQANGILFRDRDQLRRLPSRLGAERSTGSLSCSVSKASKALGPIQHLGNVKVGSSRVGISTLNIQICIPIFLPQQLHIVDRNDTQASSRGQTY